MTAALVEQAPAKINLTLRVLRRRADGYHDLESLVAFADVADLVRLQPGADDGLEIAGTFAAQSGPLSDNLVIKALHELRGRMNGLRAGRFSLEKKLPVAAGLGGGSADAAAALRLLARLNDIHPTDGRLTAAARSVGADVPVCLDPRPRIMRGVGEQLSAPLDFPPLPAVLVNPGVPVATRDVFGRFSAANDHNLLARVPQDFDALIECIRLHGNDLTEAAVACAPVIGLVLDALNALPGCKLARMSGSGATCFALFRTGGEAGKAARRLQQAHETWWIRPATLGLPPARS
ncbi:MAG TPA: 4-(cytidine 5'-diphospho)-2-C-methyl-D-erythritol kinase [Pseudolabrys sp.]|nr:4-(cytidine 5'-diphospho)-2-C-methyl-D-erythritol kinase [Pseudolabrys sp.]